MKRLPLCRLPRQPTTSYHQDRRAPRLVVIAAGRDAIHRCPTGGTLEYGPTLLYKYVLGEANRHEGDGYVVNLLGTEEVKQVAAAIRLIEEAWMRGACLAIDPGEYDTGASEDDFGYTWGNFRELRRFFKKAAVHDRAVVFTVDQ